MPAGGCHVRLHAAMDLLLAASEPGSTAVTQAARLEDLRHAQQLAVEASGGRLGASWNRDLDMVNAGDSHLRSVISRGVEASESA